LRYRLFDVAAQTIEARLGGNELLLELGAPGRMGEVAGADHADALAARPGGEMLEIEVEIPARRPRGFRVDVQGRVAAHGSHALFRAAPCSSELRERCGGASGEHRRADIKARFGRKRKAPLWTFERLAIALHAC